MDTQLRHQIVKELSLEGMSEQEKDIVITTLGGLILQTLVQQVIHTLSPEKVHLFETLIQAGDQYALLQFLSENVEDLDAHMYECSKKVINEYKKL